MNKFISSLAAIALVITSVVISPALAAGMAITDTLSSTVAGATTVGHTVAFTTATGLLAGDTIKITFDAGFTALAATASANYLGDGGILDAAAVVGNVVTITLGDAKLAGAITIGAGITATNPIAGNYTVSVVTSKGDFGALVVPVGNANQVSVSATVDPIFTFSLSKNALALGTLSTSAYTASDSLIATSTTNAIGGIAVNMAATGLKSATREIGTSIDAVMADTVATDYYKISTNATPAFDDTAGVITTAAGAMVAATQQISAVSGAVKVTLASKVDAATEAGSYADTLTFTATPTF